MSRIIAILVVLAAVAVCAVAKTTVRITEPLVEPELEQLFQEFIKEYGRVYASESMKLEKFQIFKQNMERARQLNLKNPRATFGVTKFMDLTAKEFKARYTSRLNMAQATKQFPRLSSYKAVRDVPQNWDWRQKGAVTYVKNQQDCGSCWSFSITGNLEGLWFLAGNNLTALSEQQILDCDHDCDPQDPKSCDDGCNGGLMSTGFNWIITKNNGTLATENSYPYYAYTSKCQTGKPNIKNGAYGITSYTMLPTNEDQIKEYLYEHGPVSVGMNADSLQSYQWGILDGGGCSDEIDHGVLLVGYGWHDSKWFSPYGWWIVKNSWGEDFGEDGYFRLSYGHGACGINTFASSATITKQ